jgi:D-beta-D-heptose 7-phosphate kinase/D-beta-D-heptose 1-phosphate adenosyltransferase
MNNASLTLETLTATLSQFAAARVTVVGDLMLDRFVYGTVQRISPEAPVPVLRIERETAMPGGAGNVASNIAALGATATLVSVVGDDRAGRDVADLLQADQHIDAHLIAEAGRPTTVKNRYVGHSQQLLRTDSETTRPISEVTRARIVQDLERACASTKLVLLSDYGKGVLAHGFCRDLVEIARRHGCQIIIDPKGSDYRFYAGADVITPNHHELAEASRMPTESDDDVIAAARHIIDTIGVRAVLATRGARGMALVSKDCTPLLVPARAQEVFDVSGAGDTSIATLAVAISSGVIIEEAVAFANAAAGIVVGKLGTATCSIEELATILAPIVDHPIDFKIVDAERLASRIARWRQLGRRIGFTNGCFDLLHPGHVSLLRQARAACDHLIVGLNSDQSVRRLKGPTRPINTQAARATVLASLADVDVVTIFEEDTPLSLIETVRPDVLIKGADYAAADVVGGSFVSAYGGRVLLASLEAGFSTTGIVGKMAVNT